MGIHPTLCVCLPQLPLLLIFINNYHLMYNREIFLGSRVSLTLMTRTPTVPLFLHLCFDLESKCTHQQPPSSDCSADIFPISHQKTLNRTRSLSCFSSLLYGRPTIFIMTIRIAHDYVSNLISAISVVIDPFLFYTGSFNGYCKGQDRDFLEPCHQF